MVKLQWAVESQWSRAVDGATVGGEKEEVQSTREEFKVLLFRGRGGTES